MKIVNRYQFLNDLSQLLLILIVIFFYTSCASLLFSSSEPLLKSENYHYKNPSSDWTTVNSDKSDFAFMNIKTGAVITGNTICKKYISNSLQELSSNILTGVQNLQIISSTEHNLFGRKTIINEAKGEVDGIPISLLTYTLKKNRCIYDFIMIYPATVIPKDHHNEMKTFIKHVEID